MESQPNEPKGADVPAFKRIAELEAAIEKKLSDQKLEASKSVEELKKDLTELKEKIVELMVLLEALKSLARVAKIFERSVVFLGKVAIAGGFIYAVYKFGLQELAEKIKTVGMGGK